MRTQTLKAFSPALILCLLFMASCKKDKCTTTVTYKTYEPVYMSYDELRAAVKSEPAKPLKKPGKIYMKGNYIFVNEIDKGIHIIDNTSPSSPVNVAFINIPGNIDIAASGDVLYADSYIDLVTLDISNPANVTVLNRVNDALPYRLYTGNYYADPTQGVAIEWKEKMVTEKINNDCNGGGGWYGGGPVLEDKTTTGGSFNSPQTSSSGGNAPGIGGSSARFTIAKNALYIVDNTSLHVYDISNKTNPMKVSDQNLGWGIETIFPYKNNLFIGSNTAFYIYDNTNALSPVYVSQYSHVTACDPVVVDDQYAYFTLNSDAPCGTNVNQLEIVDITNKANPTQVVVMPMSSPRGLGINNKKLFVCDNNEGLKVYDVTDAVKVADNQVAHFNNINAADVIPWNNRLLMIGNDGLYQYDYSNIQNITLLSRIPVEQ